jgi:hypothetical protein
VDDVLRCQTRCGDALRGYERAEARRLLEIRNQRISREHT